jgi:LytS/YehU family sensor histidine kinase
MEARLIIILTIRYRSKRFGCRSVESTPLILQPYVEMQYGMPDAQEKGQLDIEVWQEEDWVYLKVTDNGIGRGGSELESKSATRHKSMGLRITASRIA